jgi:hypothetical protein
MDYKKYREKICTMLDQLFEKPDLSVVEMKNATEAFELLHKMDEVQRGESMRDQFGESYNGYYPNNYGSPSSWVASGPYPTLDYGDSYGRQMRSSVTGRYMNNNSGNNTYGHSIKDRMVAQLEDMMDQAHNDYERKEIQNEIQKLRMNDMM